MECEEARNAAWLAEDGEPPPPDAARHLSDCPECRAALDGRRRVIDAYRALGEAPPGALLRERVLRAAVSRPAAPLPWMWAASAAAAFLAAVGWGAWRLREPARAPASYAAFVFESPRASVEDRLDALEQDLQALSNTSNRTDTTYSVYLEDLRRRIEALEKSLEAAQPGRKDGGQGTAPGATGGERAC
jgi:hypothetical protein